MSIPPLKDLQITPALLGGTQQADPKNLPNVHLPMYMIKLLPSGARVLHVELSEIGPFIDFPLCWHQEADSEMLESGDQETDIEEKGYHAWFGEEERKTWRWAI